MKSMEAKDTAVKAQRPANRWGLAMMIPVVNLFTSPVYVMSADQYQEARVQEERAEKAIQEARAAMDKAKSEREQAEIAANHIAELVKLMKEVESICEAQGAFWEFQANKFGSFASSVSSVGDFIELGLGDDAVEEILQWLKERKEELLKYHKVMVKVNNSFNFITSLQSTPFPQLTALPSLSITLEQNFMLQHHAKLDE